MRIHLRNLELHSLVGVYPEERHAPQRLIAHVTLYPASARSAATDALEDTVDYAEVAKQLAALALAAKFQLIESLAAHLADQLLAQFNQLAAIEIELAKPGADVPADVSVLLRRER